MAQNQNPSGQIHHDSVHKRKVLCLTKGLEGFFMADVIRRPLSRDHNPLHLNN